MASEQKRIFLALALSAAVLFGWQAFLAPKPDFKKEFKKEETVASSNPTTTESVQNTVSEQAPVAVSDGSPSVENQKVTLSNGENEVVLSNRFEILNYKSKLANDSLSTTVGGRKALVVYIINGGKPQPLIFDKFESNGATVTGFSEAYRIRLQGALEDDGVFRWSLISSNPYQYYFLSESEKKEGEARQIRQFLTAFKEVTRTNIDDDEELDGKLQWFGVDYHYHLFATVLDNKAVSASKVQDKNLEIKIIDPTTKLSGFNIFTKKNYDELNERGKNLHLSIDFGVFGVIAVPILKGLQFIYNYIPNYGLAIILITIFIRTLLFPLQFKSFKSMKKMQKLQPQLAKLKEKFKDDPQRMQKETMELFKRNGANPMGGCLPMILQTPVFFAFYQVLFNSVELLGAPFAFWIHDLSAKDPYYVLPVLMGAAMFGQTKLNPSTTADPTQQKMMMFMPLIFTFFMKDLPAGLNLYIFVSTVYGIIQQLIVYKTVD